MLSTPDEAGIEHGSIQGFYENLESKPVLHVTGSSAIQVPTSGGPSTIFSNANSDLSLTQSAELVGVAFVFRPHALRYTVSVAQVRRFELEFSSGPDTNRLQAFDSGYAASIGVAGSFVPQSVASVGIGWDLRYRFFRVDFDRFESAAGTASSTQRLTQDELQGAVVASKRFGTLAPYGGLKVQRWVTRLEDKTTRERMRGVEDGASPFLGVEWTPSPGEVAMIEGSLVKEKGFSAQWAVRF